MIYTFPVSTAKKNEPKGFPLQYGVSQVLSRYPDVKKALEGFGFHFPMGNLEIPLDSISEIRLNEISTLFGAKAEIIDCDSDVIQNVELANDKILVPGINKRTRLGLALMAIGYYVESTINTLLREYPEEGIPISLGDETVFITKSRMPAKHLRVVDPDRYQSLSLVSYALSIGTFSRLDTRNVLFEWFLTILKHPEFFPFFLDRSLAIGDSLGAQSRLRSYAFEYGQFTPNTSDEDRNLNLYHCNSMASYLAVLFSLGYD